MRATWLVFRREMVQYFTSPFAYLIAFAFLLLTGLAFNNELALSIAVRPVNPALVPVVLSTIMVLLAPLLTMRLLAEESREGTIELLLTAPISDSSIVIGKFFSAWMYFTLLLLATWVYQIILMNISTPDIAHTIGAYLGIWLYGGAALAVGLAFSAMTDSQLLAAFLSTTLLLLLYFGEGIGQVVPSADLAQIIFNLTLLGHFSPSFAVGVIRLEDIVYYAGVITMMLFIAIQVMQSRRWR